MHVSSACCWHFPHLELSLCCLQIVQMLSATASIANQACFGPMTVKCFDMVSFIIVRVSHKLFVSLISWGLVLPSCQCCDQCSGQITKDYDEFNLER